MRADQQQQELNMQQASLQGQTGTAKALRVVVVGEMIVFLVASALHTGAFGVPRLIAAMIVEGLCGIACVVLVYALFARRRWALSGAIGIEIFTLVSVLVGISAVLSSPDLRTPINLGLHAIMLVLILAAFALLAIPATRAALRNGA
jgi:hypothetical protein